MIRLVLFEVSRMMSKTNENGQESEKEEKQTETDPDRRSAVQQPIEDLRVLGDEERRMISTIGRKGGDRTISRRVQLRLLAVIFGHDAKRIDRRVIQEIASEDFTLIVDGEESIGGRKNRIGYPAILTRVEINGGDIEQGFAAGRSIVMPMTTERRIESRRIIIDIQDVNRILQSNRPSRLTVISNDQHQSIVRGRAFLAIDPSIDREKKRTLLEHFHSNQIAATFNAHGQLSVQTGILISDGDVS